ncbi:MULTISPECIES: hypothetical protein [Streptomyces]|uniref:hypothetical protein n=1 Tax=Streptomyces TaxID=1883 RepID=UPI00226DC9CB|nr:MULTISPECIES: hypothetical protein [unclassified Streptomyces]MCY0923293.1 hypothetical protein [Streptomyces sp. H27-G5]MCY0943964.1 hypothetical protein [Streptomyces sp. H34-AA3]MCY0956316.1 hypothetical protein [Streptomyces sp. H27-H5]MCZ4082336.1 hypothetical protein [Streptomyces sp. H34-S5]
MRPVWWTEELWSRHVRHRKLHRMLDGMRAHVEATMPPDWRTPEHEARSLQRLRLAIAKDAQRELIRQSVVETDKRDAERAAIDESTRSENP